MGNFPYWPKLTIPPHPYPCENHAPFDLVDASIAGRIHLINYDAYLLDGKHNICRMPRYTISDKFKPKT